MKSITNKNYVVSLFIAIFFLTITSLSYANCQGCCSHHGGVVCSNGVTKCGDGTPLSATCAIKGCNKCGYISFPTPQPTPIPIPTSTPRLIPTPRSTSTPTPIPLDIDKLPKIEGNTANDSFEKSKRLLLKIYLDARQGDFYCGALFNEKSKITNPNGYTPKHDTARARRIEWDHIVPAESFGQSFKEWRDGDPACVDSKGKALKGRDCAEKMNPTYRLMQADMYNLRPEIGEINGLRSNYSFAMLGGDKSEFGACQVKIADRKIEPPPNVRGDVARIYFYMDAAYPKRGIISDKNQKLFQAWDKTDPVDAFECALYEKIKKLQGNENPIMLAACAGNQPAQPTPPPTPKPTLTPTPKAGYDCSVKKACKDMTSCAEAKFQLTECGNKSLDRNGDGIPCESLCQ
jgi:deoxyribonuclease-1